MNLQAEWNEFLRALKRHGVRFLLVGAHAVAADRLTALAWSEVETTRRSTVRQPIWAGAA